MSAHRGGVPLSRERARFVSAAGQPAQHRKVTRSAHVRSTAPAPRLASRPERSAQHSIARTRDWTRDCICLFVLRGPNPALPSAPPDLPCPPGGRQRRAQLVGRCGAARAEPWRRDSGRSIVDFLDATHTLHRTCTTELDQALEARNAHRAMQCSAVRCSAQRCSAMQCDAVQCSAVRCREIGGGARGPPRVIAALPLFELMVPLFELVVPLFELVVPLFELVVPLFARSAPECFQRAVALWARSDTYRIGAGEAAPPRAVARAQPHAARSRHGRVIDSTRFDSIRLVLSRPSHTTRVPLSIRPCEPCASVNTTLYAPPRLPPARPP
jgi:hypothetical protein